MRHADVFLVIFALSLSTVSAAAQGDQDKPIVSPAAAAKFMALPTAPKCFTIAVERGDPNTGPSVILARFAPGCVAPYHWHTPSETAMIVSGSLEAQMKDDKAFVGHHGDFVYFPPHHVHRATCVGAAPCVLFLASDAAFDIHWVDKQGKEISLDEAVKAAAPASKKKTK